LFYMKQDRYHEFLENFGKAVVELEQAVSIYPNASKLEINGTIQVFEFTYELAWKTLKKFFEVTKNEEISFAIDAFRFAKKVNLIDDEQIWVEMKKDRNSTSHIYEEELAIKIYKRIVTLYYKVLSELFKKLKNINV